MHGSGDIDEASVFSENGCILNLHLRCPSSFLHRQSSESKEELQLSHFSSIATQRPAGTKKFRRTHAVQSEKRGGSMCLDTDWESVQMGDSLREEIGDEWGWWVAVVAEVAEIRRRWWVV
ncbi:hypothetical protein SAY87_012622 [Trapa incisa]|uniref:Uncharacterized protein n=1 Tax=Trapa incisa TaxID=236973 RepID=A0AAN7GQN3_9MYRT|nr:hypothetical protein SAY87_012622 [Trapa incisa]